MKKQKKIKNKYIRRILRTIANWDNCPIDNRKNWRAYFLNILLQVVTCAVALLAMMSMVIAFN